jgi:putative NADH-flavin reductase
MKIAVFGATGPIGAQVVKRGLQDGHSIQILSRSEFPQKHSLIKALKGDFIVDTNAVGETIKGTICIDKAVMWLLMLWVEVNVPFRNSYFLIQLKSIRFHLH